MSSLSTSLGTVSTAGASTGINSSALIDELVNAVSGPRNLVQRKIASTNQLSTLYTTLNTKMSTLDTSLSAIQTASNFREFTGTSSDTDIATVSTDGDAVAGSYSITINSLATAQIADVTLNGADTFSAVTDTVFGTGESGSFTVSLNGTATTITYDDTTTWGDIKDDIDDIDGISAYIVQLEEDDDLGTGDVFKVFIQSDTAGLDEGSQRITFDFTNLDGSSTGATSDMQAGANASATIAGETITSDTNVFSVIDGIDITAVSTGTVSITAALDTTAMATKVQTFVSAYNDIFSFIESNSSFSSTGTNQSSVSIGPFNGQSVPRFIKQRLQSIIAADYGSALSLSSSTQRTALSQMGITTDEDTGLLQFNSTAFGTALGSYQSSVEALFSSTSGSMSDTMRDFLDSYIDATTGSFESLQDRLEDNVDRLESSLDYHNRRLTRYRARLTRQFTQLEALNSTLTGTQNFITSFFSNDNDN
jgi:flagellar hook-associated protein 2